MNQSFTDKYRSRVITLVLAVSYIAVGLILPFGDKKYMFSGNLRGSENAMGIFDYVAEELNDANITILLLVFFFAGPVLTLIMSGWSINEQHGSFIGKPRRSVFMAGLVMLVIPVFYILNIPIAQNMIGDNFGLRDFFRANIGFILTLLFGLGILVTVWRDPKQAKPV